MLYPAVLGMFWHLRCTALCCFSCAGSALVSECWSGYGVANGVFLFLPLAAPLSNALSACMTTTCCPEQCSAVK
jgi:hypothetical protein